ncbi:Mu-like prophage major head subunit gpT family protein [Escherichia coli]|nr:Mu-like prophage major head subunit gpT family protein [Escherichia coli]
MASEIPSSSASNTYGWMKDLPEIKNGSAPVRWQRWTAMADTLANKTLESSDPR